MPDSLVDRIERYTLSPFYEDSGPRRDLILCDMIDLTPMIDQVGNVWVKKGNSPYAVVLSSHMDTVFEPGEYKFVSRDSGDPKLGPELEGTLDNAIGCAINAELALNYDFPITLYHVFTVDEEPDRSRTEGAYSIVAQLVKERINPSLIICLDITDPSETGPYVDGDGNDETDFYLENFSSEGLFQLVSRFVHQNKGKLTIGLRREFIEDEAWIYGQMFNSFSLCPTSFGGDSHNDDCQLYLTDASNSIIFLEKMLREVEFIQSIAAVDHD